MTFRGREKKKYEIHEIWKHQDKEHRDFMARMLSVSKEQNKANVWTPQNGR